MLIDIQQKPLYYVARLWDITRINIEVALQASENRFALFAKICPTVNFGLNIHQWNMGSGPGPNSFEWC